MLRYDPRHSTWSSSCQGLPCCFIQCIIMLSDPPLCTPKVREFGWESRALVNFLLTLRDDPLQLSRLLAPSRFQLGIVMAGGIFKAFCFMPCWPSQRHRLAESESREGGDLCEHCACAWARCAFKALQSTVTDPELKPHLGITIRFLSSSVADAESKLFCPTTYPFRLIPFACPSNVSPALYNSTEEELG